MPTAGLTLVQSSVGANQVKYHSNRLVLIPLTLEFSPNTAVNNLEILK